MHTFSCTLETLRKLAEKYPDLTAREYALAPEKFPV